jgi:hypothetical protein
MVSPGEKHMLVERWELLLAESCIFFKRQNFSILIRPFSF